MAGKAVGGGVAVRKVFLACGRAQECGSLCFLERPFCSGVNLAFESDNTEFKPWIYLLVM